MNLSELKKFKKMKSIKEKILCEETCEKMAKEFIREEFSGIDIQKHFEEEYLKGKNNFFILDEKYDILKHHSKFMNIINDYLINNTESFVFYKESLMSMYNMRFYPVNKSDKKYRKRRQFFSENKEFIISTILLIFLLPFLLLY